MTLLLLLLEEAILLPCWLPYWYGCRSYQVERSDEGVVGYTSIFLRWKDDPKAAVLTSSEVALNLLRIRCQYLVALLDGGVVGIARMIG